MQVYLLRHGIAEDARRGSADSARALTPEGRKKVKEVLGVAKQAGTRPTLVLTSPLRRAVETAEIAVAALGLKKSDLVQTHALIPSAAVTDAWEEIRVYKDEEALLLVGHEPLFGLLFAYLLGEPGLLIDFKKGALARIDIESFGPQPRGVQRWFLPPKLAAE
ncbi:MAG: phosphohistidine phosphatase SixA [Acidobacteria bacterium]|nr:phosphohistidine phosphatase SixA [Acidobacteriota bacterium]